MGGVTAMPIDSGSSAAYAPGPVNTPPINIYTGGWLTGPMVLMWGIWC